MSTTPHVQKPAFHVPEPNRLMGTNVQVTLNAAMSRKLCDLIEETELDPKEAYLYALAKNLRRYYRAMTQEREKKEEESRELEHSS